MSIVRKKAGRISPVLMGNYDNSTTYRRLDWVYYGGTSYICKRNNTVGIVPSNTERWQKIIELQSEINMAFDIATTRTNIVSGEKLSVILGKIAKFFSDLETVAFTGSYNDLSNKPNSLKNPNTLNIKFNGASQASYDGSAQKEVNITPAGISAVNTSALLNTTEQIFANTNANNITGALVAKEIMTDYNNKITQINSNFSDYVYPPSYGGDADNIKTNHHGFAFNMSNLPAYYGFLDVSTFNGLYFAPAPNGVVRQCFTEWDTGNTFTRTFQNDAWTMWRKFSLTQNDDSVNANSTWASIFNELKQSSVYVRSVSYFVPDHPLITPPPNTREAHLALVVVGYGEWRMILDADIYNSRLYWAAFSGDEPNVWHELS